MFFNSQPFFIFLPVVFAIYWLLNKKNILFQNFFLLVASYFFYACWDWRFLFLLIFSTSLDYYTGIKIHQEIQQKWKTIWLWISIGINLGFLGIFKYYNFFQESLAFALQKIGIHANFWSLKVILPVGISFYTFHGLSYVIDIYKDRIKPEKNIITYSLFVSYFPLLVAGPIERATHLLPQLKKKREFNIERASDGLRQILWGLFKKMVIADNCAIYANSMFEDPSHHSASALVLGAIFFAFQIYGDFSGYSDIALGVSRLFGIELLKNFNFPYFSRDIAEFWRRWHISLSSWFRDYLYIPLGGSQGGLRTKIRNTFIIFIVSGFWHGANWTFIVWGGLNALYFLPLLIQNANRNNIEIVAKGKYFPTIKEALSMVVTFALTVLAWVFFRANSVGDAFHYLNGMFSRTMFSIPNQLPKFEMILLLLFLIIEWFGRESNYAIETMFLKKPSVIRYLFYYVILFAILYLSGDQQQFIYFQF